jgi:uncharacterized membrane protein YadS
VTIDSITNRTWTLAPGVFLAALITAISLIIAEIEEIILGHAVLEPLVLALILGLVLRAMWIPPGSMEPGIAFSGKQLLEFAIVVLGLTLNLTDIVDAGAKILISVLLLVSLTLLSGVAIGKAMGLGTPPSPRWPRPFVPKSRRSRARLRSPRSLAWVLCWSCPCWYRSRT